MESRGIAPLIAVAVIVTALGASTAIPVAASVANVDPDHPLYPVKRMGERIRGLSDVEQMKLRWQEYQKMVEKGKGLQYQSILKEFVDKLNSVAPYDVKTKQEIISWMQKQMPGIGEIRLKLAEQIAEEDKELENEVRQIRACWERERNLEDLSAGMLHLKERIRERVREQYLRIENLLENACLKMRVQENLAPIWQEARQRGEEILRTKFNHLREVFENKYPEVEAMLFLASENLPGRRAAERLVGLALKEKDLALHAYDEDLLGRAVGIMTSAVMHLRNAERILEHAQEWEPQNAPQWEEWRERWEGLKEEVKELWENVQQNLEQFRNRIREEWGG
ncbi:MAG: hypothetical protein DSO03_00300 [Hadesarchaea archaeon]|nr:MAG: hypothetical protein DSO03_00300 [Hadesarchaea archaeon]